MESYMDVIIFSGQSNMQGQTEQLTNTETVSSGYEYRYLSDELIPLKNPVGEDIKNNFAAGWQNPPGGDAHIWLAEHIAGSSCYGYTNLVPEFCRAYLLHTDGNLCAVHIAKGSTQIAEWLPGTLGYDVLIKKTSSALSKIKSMQKKIRHIFFVWLQGESDACAGNSKDYYKEKITLLKNSLKKDIGIELFSIIRVGRFANDNRDDEILAAQDEICKEDNDFSMLTDITKMLIQRPEYMNPDVRGHYSAKGLETLGFIAGTALGTLAK